MPKVSKIKRKKLKDPILGFLWFLQQGGTENSAIDWYIKQLNLGPRALDTHENIGSFASNSKEQFSGCLWVSDAADEGTMAHECAHAVNHVCRILEMDPRAADEFYASYVGYLMRNLNRLC